MRMRHGSTSCAYDMYIWRAYNMCIRRIEYEYGLVYECIWHHIPNACAHVAHAYGMHIWHAHTLYAYKMCRLYGIGHQYTAFLWSISIEVGHAVGACFVRRRYTHGRYFVRRLYTHATCVCHVRMPISVHAVHRFCMHMPYAHQLSYAHAICICCVHMPMPHVPRANAKCICCMHRPYVYIRHMLGHMPTPHAKTASACRMLYLHIVLAHMCMLYGPDISRCHMHIPCSIRTGKRDVQFSLP